jgi:hypothetical protein
VYLRLGFVGGTATETQSDGEIDADKTMVENLTGDDHTVVETMAPSDRTLMDGMSSPAPQASSGGPTRPAVVSVSPPAPVGPSGPGTGSRVSPAPTVERPRSRAASPGSGTANGATSRTANQAGAASGDRRGS